MPISSAAPRNRGGWPATKYLDHEQFREARRRYGLLVHAGFPATVFATVRPPDGLTA